MTWPTFADWQRRILTRRHARRATAGLARLNESITGTVPVLAQAATAAANFGRLWRGGQDGDRVGG